MPISASQHRASNGLYQNTLHNNPKGNRATQGKDIHADRSALSEKAQYFRNSIIDAYPSDSELIRPSYKTKNLRKDIAIPLLMLLSQVRCVDNPVSAIGRTIIPASEIQPPLLGHLELPDTHHHLPADLWQFIPQTLSRVGEFMLQYDPLRFPEASALSREETLKTEDNPDINRPSRYALFKDKSATPPSLFDDVKIEKIDLSCINARQSLSITDVFRKIGKTLSNPVSELAKESQVISYYNNYYRCPTPEETTKLESITSKVDNLLSIVTSLIPGSQPLVVTQRLGGPLFKMIADSMEGKDLDLIEVLEVNDQILGLLKGIVDSSGKNTKGTPLERELSVPEGLSLKNNKIMVNINGKESPLTYENGGYFIHTNGKRRRVSYSIKDKKWTKTYKFIKTYDDDIYFQHKIGKKLSGEIDKTTLSSITLHRDAVYHVTKRQSGEPFYAIKIGNNFYRYTPISEENVSLNGVIQTNNAEIKVSRFDRTYFIVNEENKLFINYTPCRLARTPGTPCIHLSESVVRKLKMSRKIGIPAHKIRGLKPSETQPGLYESAKGKRYIRYGYVYFKLIEIKNEPGESKFMVVGGKIFRNKEITQVCFSRERGLHYINTLQENMMENTGISKLEAISYLDASTRRQAIIAGAEHIDEFHDFSQIISSEKVAKKVDVSTLSVPDYQGLRTDVDGHQYIETKQGYLKLEKENDLHFITMENGDKVYMEYTNNKFKLKNINRYHGMVSSTPNEMVKDLQINSFAGLDILEYQHLNSAWSLKRINIKNLDFNDSGSVGSKIAITFTMQYKKQKGNKYVEMPALQWKEKINFQESDSKWYFETDMYKHNTNSMTFFPWRIRYVEAYNFAKAKNKDVFNSNVKIYKKNMKPITVNEIRNAKAESEKVKIIQNFLARNGGVMEITITDIPQIIKRETTNTKERNVMFDIGFNNKVEAHFNQGIFLDPHGKTNVFVTTSDNINLARAVANVQPPEIVTKPREHHVMQGEVY